MKKIEISIAAAFLICVISAFVQLPFAKTCEEVRTDTLRLHIIANSDNPEDQEVKLAVRDAILKQSEHLFSSAGSKAEAESNLEAKLGEIKRIARRTLSDNGFEYPVAVTVADTYFNQREYDGFTLPAGTYTALRVELGGAKGKNWWCVLYPTLCVPCATDIEPLSEYSDEERDLVKGTEKYKIKFKLEEWLQSLIND
ncbi:MAG: stage II sporulation protein R [Oscillospiraceae bacterium]